MKEQGKLNPNLVVSTVMANLGFRRSMDQAGIEVVETAVGDRYVMEALTTNQGVIGGEQSGHIIFTKHGGTGDGLLTAMELLNVMAGTGKGLRELRAEAITEYPQVLVNVEVSRTADLASADAVWDEVAMVEAELGPNGRVLVRSSGTEPLVRIMVEASSEALAQRQATRLATLVDKHLGAGASGT
jgi:phosphoglucosamine mutase